MHTWYLVHVQFKYFSFTNAHCCNVDQITRVSGTSLLQNNAVVRSQLISVHRNTARDLSHRKQYLSNSLMCTQIPHLTWILFWTATRAKRCCKWNSHNINVLVQVCCSSWGRYSVSSLAFLVSYLLER
jgi:hypothetical protein